MVCAIIQARLGSTRLPGKVLRELNGKPMLSHILDRLSYCKEIDKVVVATSVSKNDDELAAWCQNNNVVCCRGDEKDVLARYHAAARESGADIIVRITADDPFKDPLIVDEVIKILKTEDLDFAFNNSPPTFPEGMDTEVFTFEALCQAVECCSSDFEKEHVTQFFYRNPHVFKMKNYPFIRNASSIRLTVDVEEDFRFAEEIYIRLSPNGEMFFLEDILCLLDSEPGLLNINKHVKRSAMYVKQQDT